MASEYTPNRRYPLYTDSDKPNLRDQYNGAIREIDTDMAQALQDSSVVASALGAGFDAQHTVRMAIESNAQAVTDEASARTSADTALGTRITNETSARENADTALGTRITNETSARENDDTALGTRIDNEVTARQNADTALGTRIDNETSARQSADTALGTRITNEIEERIVGKYTGWTAIWIGDSFTIAGQSGVTKRFSTQVSEHYGLTEKNFAAGATGFEVGTAPFSTQMQNAVNDSSIDKSKVKFVFVCGGRNDASDTNTGRTPNIATARANMNTICNLFKQNYPNATLVFIPMLYECVCPSALQMRWYGYLMYNLNEAVSQTGIRNCIIVPNAFTWLQGKYSQIIAADKIHPNQRGHNTLAFNILNAINGQQFTNAIQAVIPILIEYKENSPHYVHMYVDDSGTIWLSMNITLASAVSFGAYIAQWDMNPAYESADALFVMRGNKFFSCAMPNNSGASKTFAFQIECSNNFSLNDAVSIIKIQALSAMAANDVLVFNQPIGKIGIDTTIGINF